MCKAARLQMRRSLERAMTERKHSVQLRTQMPKASAWLLER
jgi:hypothetical protein